MQATEQTIDSRRANGAAMSDPTRDGGQATRASAHAGGGITQHIHTEIALGSLAVGLFALVLGAQAAGQGLKGGSEL